MTTTNFEEGKGEPGYDLPMFWEIKRLDRKVYVEAYTRDKAIIRGVRKLVKTMMPNASSGIYAMWTARLRNGEPGISIRKLSTQDPAYAKAEEQLGRFGTNMENETVSIFTPETDLAALRPSIKAPFVNMKMSTLGGPERATIMLTISLLPREEWRYGIYENSPGMRFSIHRTGEVEQFYRSPEISKKFRKIRVRSLDEAISKINAYVSVLKPMGEETNRFGNTFMKYGESEARKIVNKMLFEEQGSEKLVSAIRGKLGNAVEALASQESGETFERDVLADYIYNHLDPAVKKELDALPRAEQDSIFKKALPAKYRT